MSNGQETVEAVDLLLTSVGRHAGGTEAPTSSISNHDGDDPTAVCDPCGDNSLSSTEVRPLRHVVLVEPADVERDDVFGVDRLDASAAC